MASVSLKLVLFSVSILLLLKDSTAQGRCLTSLIMRRVLGSIAHTIEVLNCLQQKSRKLVYNLIFINRGGFDHTVISFGI